MKHVSTMNDIVRATLQLERLSSRVMTFFGLAALLMATLGIYGVLSYFVRQRTVELRTRMVLGAVNHDLVALVLGGGLKLSLAGVAVGAIALVGGVWLLVRYLEVANFGWLPFAASTAVVTLVAAAAASVPTWRTPLSCRRWPPSASTPFPCTSTRLLIFCSCRRERVSQCLQLEWSSPKGLSIS
jgi:ABC-type antimicrobial peptide transport system permease subunit